MKHTYPYIVAWGRIAGQFSGYIETQVQLAIEEKAPTNAVWKDGPRWITLYDIRHKATRDKIQKAAQVA